MKDKLEIIWDIQSIQQADFNMDPKAMSPVGRISSSKDLNLGLLEEVAKLSSRTACYKAHILKAFPIDKTNIIEAVVDVFKYTVAIAQVFGISHDEVYEEFIRKTEIVSDKARGERLELESKTPVLVFDIDNVIADLTEWDEKLKKVRNIGAVDGTEKHVVDVLEGLKETYYKDGGFLRLKTIPGARKGIKELRKRGWKIVLVTARPYWQYKRIYADTVCWLKDNNIEYDLLLFNKDKAEAIYESIFPATPAYVVEDREKHVIEVVDLGIKVLLFSWPWNKGIKESKLITRVNDWEGIVNEIGYPIPR